MDRVLQHVAGVLPEPDAEAWVGRLANGPVVAGFTFYLLAGEAAYLSGRFKPRYMMQGLDETFQAAVFLGYHAAIATPGVLSHTYNPRAIADVRLNGTTTGEAGLNALVAQHFRVPVAAITGDQYVGPEAAPFCPGINTSRSRSRPAGTPH